MPTAADTVDWLVTKPIWFFYGAFVYRVAINQCRDQLHGTRRRDALREGARSNGRIPHAAETDAVDTLVRDERVDRVRRHVASLSERRRETILLCYHDGLTHEQVAEVLEIPLGTVKSRLHAALEELRARFAVKT